MQIIKSIGAVLLGFLTVVVLSMGTDWILEAVGVFPPPTDQGLFVPWMLVLALVYRTLYTVVGGYVTAKISPSNPSIHVNVLGLIGTVAGVAGVVVGWNLSAHWYPIALAVLAYPSVWLGGKLFLKRQAEEISHM